MKLQVMVQQNLPRQQLLKVEKGRQVKLLRSVKTIG